MGPPDSDRRRRNGFIAATSMKLAGKDSDPRARLIARLSAVRFPPPVSRYGTSPLPASS